MKTLDRYTVSSILRTGLAAALLASLIMLGADLFSKLETYVSSSVSASVVLTLTLLRFPKSLMMVIGPAFLFSITFFLSMLHSRNELICILNAGISYSRIVSLILITCLSVSLLCFGFNETAVLESENRRAVLYESATGIKDEDGNSASIALSDMYSLYSVNAEYYDDSSNSLSRVVILEKKSEDLFVRTDALSAVWNEENGNWTLYDCVVYTIRGAEVVEIEEFDLLDKESFRIKPGLFRNSSADIDTMDLLSAVDYVLSMKIVNPEKYTSLATTLFKRLFENLTPLVFAVIACSLNYRYKKNVLLISIVSSVAVAVIYYVCRLLTTLFADQGIIRPYMGSVYPLLLILVLSALIRAVAAGKR